MAYKPPKLQTDDRGRNYVTKTIRGQRFTKYFGKAGTPKAKLAHDEFLEQCKPERSTGSGHTPASPRSQCGAATRKRQPCSDHG
ncbi:MAG: hypothetical protein CMJ68_02400 [Planctomycetaceae bacterium]|nr:hypothetical protein [Planctomycetaceae bacterium]|tara:strand:+ start:365 stop:616 length:252 start_codon:yes stop_codon:yes gene_type:complete